MMSEKGYTKKEIAELSGYTYRRLYDIDAGLPTEKKLFVKSEAGKYDLALFISRWVAYNVAKATEGDETLDDVKAAHEKVKMDKTEIEVQRLRGELVPIGEIHRLWTGIAKTISSNMLMIPIKCAPQVVMMADSDVIAGIMEKEIRNVLEALADMPNAREAQDGAEDEETEDDDA